MGFCADNHISAISSYAKQKYGKDVFSNHFIYRAFQRLTINERNAIIAEIDALVKSGMHEHLFVEGQDAVNLLLCNKFEVAFAMQKNGNLCVKTIFAPRPNRIALLKAGKSTVH